MKKKSTTKALYLSIVATFLCVAFLIGATFAWFSASKTTNNNIIRTNSFDVDVWFYEEYIEPTSDAWKAFDEGTAFDDLVFVPGSDAVRYIKFENPNAYNVKFDLVLLQLDSALNDGLENSLIVYGKNSVTGTVTVSEMDVLAPTLQTLNAEAASTGMAHMLSTVVAPAASSDSPAYGIAAVAFKLPETFSNPQGLRTTFKLRVIATQYEMVTASETAASAGELAVTTDGVTVTVPNAEAGDVYELSVANKTITDTTVSFDATLLKNGAAVQPAPGTSYTVSVNVGADRVIESLKHNGENIASYNYDPATGVLSFTTSSFSPFEVTFADVTDAVEVADEAELRAALENGGKIVLTADVSGDRFTVVKDTEIYGNGHTITDNTAGRAIWIDADNVSLTLKSLTIDGAGKCERGVQVNNPNEGVAVNHAAIVIDNCEIKGMTTYAINFCSGTTVDLTLTNTKVSGWAALNAYGSGNQIRISNCVLEGINDKAYDPWNTFATICLEGDTTLQTTDHSSDYSITIENTKIIAKQTTGNTQYAIGFNTQSLNSVITLRNVVFDVGEGCEYYYDYGEGNETVFDFNPANVIDTDVGGEEFYHIIDNEDGTFSIWTGLVGSGEGMIEEEEEF